MTENRRSVHTGSLLMGATRIPIAIYKTSDDYGLPGELYHDECGGKIRQRQFCELHPDEEAIAMTAISIGGRLVPIDSDLRNTLLERKAPLEVVSSHKLTALAPLMVSSDLVLHTRYMVSNPPNTLPIEIVGAKDDLTTLFDRLHKKKMFLLCTIGLGGMKRYAIILPDGQLYTLTYREEQRTFQGLTGQVNKGLTGHLDTLLDSLPHDFPEISLAPIDRKVQSWITRMITTKVKRSRNPKKNSTTRTKASA